MFQNRQVTEDGKEAIYFVFDEEVFGNIIELIVFTSGDQPASMYDLSFDVCYEPLGTVVYLQ